MGLNKDLKLDSNDFSNAGTAFFIAYLVAESPNRIAYAFPLTGYPSHLFTESPNGLALTWFCGELQTARTAATHTYQSLLAVQVILGMCEAAIAPFLMLISSQWHAESEQAPSLHYLVCWPKPWSDRWRPCVLCVPASTRTAPSIFNGLKDHVRRTRSVHCDCRLRGTPVLAGPANQRPFCFPAGEGSLA